jgi:uncharacterized protein (TIGR02453 family)
MRDRNLKATFATRQPHPPDVRALADTLQSCRAKGVPISGLGALGSGLGGSGLGTQDGDSDFGSWLSWLSLEKSPSPDPESLTPNPHRFDKLWSIADPERQAAMAGGPVPGTFTGFPREAITFFKGLEANNNRDWFQAHKDAYERACREPMQALMADLQPKLGASKVSRINRDIRFTPDRSPYKTHIAAGIGGYYVNLSAEGLYVGTGIYKPDPVVLARFRAAIDRDASGRQLHTIVKALERKGYDVGTHESLTSAPKGYRADHPRIDLLRMKDIFAGRAFKPAPWLSTSKALDRIQRVMRDTQPLTKWLAQHVRGPTSTKK